MRYLETKEVNVNELIDSRWQERNIIKIDDFVDDIIRSRIPPENVDPIEFATINGIKEIVDGHRRVHTFKDIIRRTTGTNYNQILGREIVDFTLVELYKRHNDANKNQPMSQREKERRIMLGIKTELFKYTTDYINYMKECEGIIVSKTDASILQKVYFYREFCHNYKDLLKLKSSYDFDVLDNIDTYVFYELIRRFPVRKEIDLLLKNIDLKSIFVNILNNLSLDYTQKECRYFCDIIFDKFKNDDYVRNMLSVKFNPKTIKIFTEEIINNMINNKSYRDVVCGKVDLYNGKIDSVGWIKNEINKISINDSGVVEDDYDSHVAVVGGKVVADWNKPEKTKGKIGIGHLKSAISFLKGSDLSGLSNIEKEEVLVILNNILSKMNYGIKVDSSILPNGIELTVHVNNEGDNWTTKKIFVPDVRKKK